MVKEKIPPERMTVIKLEDGLGWEQICPYLETPIPDVKYPRGNDPKEFDTMVQSVMVPLIRGAMLKASLVIVPAIGVGAWLLTKRSTVLPRLVGAVFS